MITGFRERARFRLAQTASEFRRLVAGKPAPSEKPLHIGDLESRVLLSATPAAGLAVDSPADVVSVPSVAQVASTSTESPPASAEDLAATTQLATTRDIREFVFIDAAAEDVEQLISDLKSQIVAGRSIDYAVLDANRDGVGQIAESLADFRGLDAVHIVSHGTDSAVKLGSTWLSLTSLDGYTGQVAGWGSALSADGDILIYGCDLASNVRGQSLVDSLASLTGADVAASVDDTGHAALGGDWNLEFATGDVEAGVAFSSALQQNWDALLTVNLYQQGAGYSGTQDTYIESDDPASTHGSSDDLIVDNDEIQQGLLRFDGIIGTTEIPAGSTINAATLTLQVSDTTTGLISFHALLADWDQASTTWNNSFGGDGVQPDDVDAVSTADDVVSGGLTTVIVNVTSSVQAWANGDDNFGWALLSSSGDEWTIHTSEKNGLEPVLSVDFTPPPPVLTPTGEFLVNAVTADQQETSGENRGSHRAVALGSDGHYAVAWSSRIAGEWQIRMRYYDAAGNPTTGEIAVNDQTGMDQYWASVGIDNAGNTVVVWTEAGGSTGVNHRRFDSQGTPLDVQMGVNSTTSGDQEDPSIAVAGDGRYVIVWEGNGPGDSSGIFGQRYDSAGNKDGGEFRVNDNTFFTQSEPSVAIAPDGSFVVTWDEFDGVYARRFDSNGVAIDSSDVRIRSELSAGETAVAMNDAGQFVATWRETGSGRDIWARVFDFGMPLTSAPPEFQVNTTSANDQTNPSVSVDAAGDFLIVWEGDDGQGDPDAVIARKFNANGAPAGGEFTVNQTSGNVQHQASVAMGDLDNFVVVWSGDGPGDSDGVFARQFGTAANNEAPAVMTSGGSLAYSENDPATVIDPGITVSDVDSATLAGAEVGFDSGFDGAQDRLTFTATPPGISGMFNTTTGVLTLSGAASPGDYETVLRTVSYENLSENPSTVDRVLRFVVDDGSLISSATRTVQVTSEDDPAIAVPGGPYAVDEGSTVTLDGSASSDVDNFIVEHEWDLDYDGVTFDVDIDGAMPVFSAATIDGDVGVQRVVALRVRSDNGALVISQTTVSITNVAPTATDDAVTVPANVVSMFAGLLENDTDPIDALSITSVTGSGVGVAMLIDPATVQYDPAGQFDSLSASQSASDTVSYTISDDDGATANASVAVTVTGVNDAPMLPPQSFAVSEAAPNGTLLGAPVFGDVDQVDSHMWTLLAQSEPGAFAIDFLSGEIRIADSDRIDFENASSMSVTLQIQDTLGATDSALMTINVSDVNEAPTTTGISDINIVEDSPAQIVDLKPAVDDVETPDPLLVFQVDSISHPSLFSSGSISGGVLTLTPAVNQFGLADVTVRAIDEGSLSVTTTFRINVAPVNDAPVANADQFLFFGSGPFVVPASGVLANDADIDGPALTAQLVTAPGTGTLTLFPAGGFVFTRDADTPDVVTFTYAATDGSLTSSPATVTLNLMLPPPPPPPPPAPPSPPSEPPPAPPEAPPESPPESGEDAASEGESAAGSDDSSASSGEEGLTDGESGSTVDGADSGEASTADSPPAIAPEVAVPEAIVSAAAREADAAPGVTDAAESAEKSKSAPAAPAGSGKSSDGKQRSQRTGLSAVQDWVSGRGTAASAEFETQRISRDELARGLQFSGEDLSFVVQDRYIEQVEELDEELVFEATVPEWAVGSAVVTSASLSVGYIVWMVRGGYMLASVLSTMPVWQNIDPLPVLDELTGDDEDDESLESMIDEVAEIETTNEEEAVV